MRRVAENSQRGAVSLILSWRFSISLSMTEKGGTGQIRVFVEMRALYTWPGA